MQLFVFFTVRAFCTRCIKYCVIFVEDSRPGSIAARALDLRLRRSKVAGSILGLALSVNNLGQVVHTHVPLSPSSMIWYQLRGGDALRPGSNRRSGVALAMRDRL